MRITRIAQDEGEDDVREIVMEWRRQEAIVKEKIPAMIQEVDSVVARLDKYYADSEGFIQKFTNIRLRASDAYKHILEIYQGFQKVAPDTDAERWARDLADKAETCLSGVADEISDMYKDSLVLRDKADEFRGALADMRAELGKMLGMGVQT